jgi:hypothetical protein
VFYPDLQIVRHSRVGGHEMVLSRHARPVMAVRDIEVFPT